MSDSQQPPVLSVLSVEKAASTPGFLLALRGIWLMTWRSQFTWRRLPMRLAGLLVLPVLVYITLFNRETWPPHQSLLGDASMPVNRISRGLTRAGLPLQSDQRAQLQQIFIEEYARTEQDCRETASPQISAARESELIDACYGRIRDRARTVLNESQFGEYQKSESRWLPRPGRVQEPRWNWTAPFYHWLIDFYFWVILPLNCVRLSGALIRDELQADTLGFLTTRPLSRARLMAAKYLSQTAWLQIVLLIQTLVIFATGQLRHIPGLGALLPLFLAAQFLAVPAWSALGALLGLVTQRYIALALLYGLIVELGIGSIPTNINSLSLMRHLKTLLAHNPALQSIYEWSGTGVLSSVGALALATAVFLALAALLFTVFEYHHTEEMQK
jgi:hypothetical protein